MSMAHVVKPFHLPSSLHRKWIVDRLCQHLWFSEFEFFYYDIENEGLSCKRVIGSYIITVYGVTFMLVYFHGFFKN